MLPPPATLPPGIDRSRKRAVILLTSSGRRVALINTLRTVAGSLKIDLRILACDRMPRSCPACLLADAAYQIPYPEDPNYIDALLEICVVHRVTLILPTESAELAPLSRNREHFAEIGTAIAISSPEMIELTSAPDDAEAILWAHGFKAAPDGPVTSVNLDAIRSGRRREHQKEDGSRHFDVLMYFDRRHQLRAIIPCERMMAAGVGVLVTRRCSSITATAERLSRHFHGLGPIVSMDATLRRDGGVTVDRLRAFLSESFEVAHRAGAEMMKWLLREYCFGSITISDDWQDGVEMIRYEAAMFVMPR